MTVVVYIVAVNFAAFVMYGIDKKKAKDGAWRIPEAELLGIAMVGGSVGAYLGMKVFRHKTKHMKFSVGIPVIFVVQIAAIMFILKNL